MSSLEQPRPEPDKDKYLTQPEREQLQRLLSQPEEFPRELGAWITEYVGTNGFLQKSQVQGLPLLNTQVQQALEQLEQTVTTLAVIGTTYTHEPGSFQQTTFNGQVRVGDPTVTVPAGTYFCILTAQAAWAAGGTNALMRMNNGATANPFGSIGRFNGLDASGKSSSLMSIGSVSVAAASNVIKGWFSQEGNGAINYEQRFLIALRTG